MTAAVDLRPASEAELAELIREAAGARSALDITGGGTRVEGLGRGAALSMGALSGIVDYAPGEMVLIARPGTPLAEVEALLAAENQMLAFEPPDMRAALGRSGVPSLGGMVAANASGPRRLRVGACRDHLLGLRFVDGRGRILKTGGRVMKNVTGLDLSKLMCGGFGTLGVLSEIALKTQPIAPATETLAFPGLDPEAAVALFAAALATPYDISGAAWIGGTAWLRIEGLAQQVPYRGARVRDLFRARAPEAVAPEAATALWRGLRDVTHFADLARPLWRIAIRPSEAPELCRRLARIGGQVSLDWGGGLVWYEGDGRAEEIRALLPSGHATRIRRGAAATDAASFTPPVQGIARLTRGLRATFDPAGIFNPGLMPV